MKLNLFVAAVMMAFSFTVRAEGTATPAECTTIVSQCEAAGFHAGDHKKNGKGLWVDCVGAVAHGKAVAGVSVSKDDAKKCAQAERAAMKAKKAAK